MASYDVQEVLRLPALQSTSLSPTRTTPRSFRPLTSEPDFMPQRLHVIGKAHAQKTSMDKLSVGVLGTLLDWVTETRYLGGDMIQRWAIICHSWIWVKTGV